MIDDDRECRRMLPPRKRGELTLQEAATITGYSISTLRRAIKRGDLQTRQRVWHGVHFVARRELNDWLDGGGIEPVEVAEVAS